MKQVQDKDGNVITVADNTPCHAGKNGALPVMLDATRDAAIFSDMATRKAAHLIAAPQQAKDKKLTALKAHYNSADVRAVTYNNHQIFAAKPARDGTTELRARLKDNVEVTTCDWFFDDGSTQTLDVTEITALNKLVIDKDQAVRRLRFDHKAAINALTTVEAIEAYDFTASINGKSWI